mmetsp:Transcript_21242/g.35422  ORF Transcript_21242/g.35422 Transcript_21242/m.35422 type:complete len:84 (+) Transcript_21242:1181-1432(+)
MPTMSSLPQVQGSHCSAVEASKTAKAVMKACNQMRMHREAWTELTVPEPANLQQLVARQLPKQPPRQVPAADNGAEIKPPIVA